MAVNVRFLLYFHPISSQNQLKYRVELNDNQTLHIQKKITHGGPSIWSDSWIRLTLIYDVPLVYPLVQPVLLISHQPRQNLAEFGTTATQVILTLLSEQMNLPVDELAHYRGTVWKVPFCSLLDLTPTCMNCFC